MFPKRQCGKRSNIFMCGIIGFTGKTNAVPLLLDGLSALEYRGYDSAGIAVFGKNGDLEVYKSKGRLAVVAEKIASLPEPLVSNCGIGHTRWATHGEPSDINAHPHGTENVYIVHNGIIENYAEIKKTLTENGYSFVSETDTEVAAKLLDMNYLETRDPLKALKRLFQSFAALTHSALFSRIIPAKYTRRARTVRLFLQYRTTETTLPPTFRLFSSTQENTITYLRAKLPRSHPTALQYTMQT